MSVETKKYDLQFHALKDINGKVLVSGDDLIKIVYFYKGNKHVKEKMWYTYFSRRQFRLAEQVDRQGIGSIPVDY